MILTVRVYLNHDAALRSWVERQLGQTIPVDVNAADFLFDFVLESKAEEADALVQKFKARPLHARTHTHTFTYTHAHALIHPLTHTHVTPHTET